MKQLCVTQAGNGPSGGASLCRDPVLHRLIGAFSIDKIEKMRGGARIAQRAVVIFQINAVNASEITKTVGYVAGIVSAHAGAHAELGIDLPDPTRASSDRATRVSGLPICNRAYRHMSHKKAQPIKMLEKARATSNRRTVQPAAPIAWRPFKVILDLPDPMEISGSPIADSPAKKLLESANQRARLTIGVS